MMLFSNLFGGKKWHESLTAWGIVVFASTKAAVQTGLLPVGADEFVALVGQAVGALFVILGLRRAGNK